METQLSNSEEATKLIAATLVDELPHNLVLLKGPLGAGKTTFVRGIGGKLGLKRILSPTYTIIRSYKLAEPFKTPYLAITHFQHVDLFRLTDAQEVDAIGFWELAENPNNLVVVEWPEVIEDKIILPHTTITIKNLGASRRELSSIVARGA